MHRSVHQGARVRRDRSPVSRAVHRIAEDPAAARRANRSMGGPQGQDLLLGVGRKTAEDRATVHHANRSTDPRPRLKAVRGSVGAGTRVRAAPGRRLGVVRRIAEVLVTVRLGIRSMDGPLGPGLRIHAVRRIAEVLVMVRLEIRSMDGHRGHLAPGQLIHEVRRSVEAGKMVRPGIRSTSGRQEHGPHFHVVRSTERAATRVRGAIAITRAQPGLSRRMHEVRRIAEGLLNRSTGVHLGPGRRLGVVRGAIAIMRGQPSRSLRMHEARRIVEGLPKRSMDGHRGPGRRLGVVRVIAIMRGQPSLSRRTQEVRRIA